MRPLRGEGEGGVVIDILVPVLGRPQNAQPLVDSILGSDDYHDVRVTFLCTPGDDEEIAACRATGAKMLLVHTDDFQYARKINAGAGWSEADWFFLGADDLDFRPGWLDQAMLTHAATGCCVIGTNDLGNPTVMAGQHATHSLVHRSYMERGTWDEPGKLLHEGYHHNFCDTEFIDTAKVRGEFAFSAASHVEHLHPFWRWTDGRPKSADDRVYEIGRRTYHADSRTFRQRQRLWMRHR